MRPKTGIIAVGILLMLPVVAAAQQAGFYAGIGVPSAPVYNAYTYNPYTNAYQNTNPYTGVPAGYVVPTIPHTPTATVVGPGTRIFVSGQKVAPGYAPTHPTRAPVVITGTPHRTFVPTHPNAYVPTSPVTTPHPNGTFINGNSRNPRNQVFITGSGADRGRVVNRVDGVTIGVTRSAVIAHYGNPTVSMVDANGEALVFGGVTVLIQNGVVTRIYQR